MIKVTHNSITLMVFPFSYGHITFFVEYINFWVIIAAECTAVPVAAVTVAAVPVAAVSVAAVVVAGVSVPAVAVAAMLEYAVSFVAISFPAVPMTMSVVGAFNVVVCRWKCCI